MSLTLPVVGTTPLYYWAALWNSLLGRIDDHNHSEHNNYGKYLDWGGTNNGIAITSDLDMKRYKTYGVGKIVSEALYELEHFGFNTRYHNRDIRLNYFRMHEPYSLDATEYTSSLYAQQYEGERLTSDEGTGQPSADFGMSQASGRDLVWNFGVGKNDAHYDTSVRDSLSYNSKDSTLLSETRIITGFPAYYPLGLNPGLFPTKFSDSNFISFVGVEDNGANGYKMANIAVSSGVVQAQETHYGVLASTYSTTGTTDLLLGETGYFDIEPWVSAPLGKTLSTSYGIDEQMFPIGYAVWVHDRAGNASVNPFNFAVEAYGGGSGASRMTWYGSTGTLHDFNASITMGPTYPPVVLNVDYASILFVKYYIPNTYWYGQWFGYFANFP